MYTDVYLKPIYEGHPYTSPSGTAYPSNFPKNEIPGLFLVAEIPRPNDPSLVITGFTIDESNTQVWQTRVKTQEELTSNLRGEVLRLLTITDMVALRCVKAGVPFPESWKTYTTILRDTFNTGTGLIPAQPAYPVGT